jgi:hypothetical protein
MKIEDGVAYLTALGVSPDHYPHGSNILTKSSGKVKQSHIVPLESILEKYINLLEIFRKYESEIIEIETKLADILIAADDYYDFIKQKEVNVFSHQSDFTSSFLPELICVLLRKLIKKIQTDPPVLYLTAQKDIVTEFNFDVAGGGRLIEKRKRMDISVLCNAVFTFNGKHIDFGIPILCAEIKTNIDKNMLSGIEASVGNLKRTFPRCKYYTIGEFSDFEIEAQNYATTAIDEILLVRHQKRSQVRKTPSARNPLSLELLNSFLNEVSEQFSSVLNAELNLAIRMASGRLI